MWKRGKVPLAHCLQGISALKTLWNLAGLSVEQLLKTFSFLKTCVKFPRFSQSYPIVIHISCPNCPHSYSQSKCMQELCRIDFFLQYINLHHLMVQILYLLPRHNYMYIYYFPHSDTTFLFHFLWLTYQK